MSAIRNQVRNAPDAFESDPIDSWEGLFTPSPRSVKAIRRDAISRSSTAIGPGDIAIVVMIPPQTLTKTTLLITVGPVQTAGIHSFVTKEIGLRFLPRARQMGIR